MARKRPLDVDGERHQRREHLAVEDTPPPQPAMGRQCGDVEDMDALGIERRYEGAGHQRVQLRSTCVAARSRDCSSCSRGVMPAGVGREVALGHRALDARPRAP